MGGADFWEDQYWISVPFDEALEQAPQGGSPLPACSYNSVQIRILSSMNLIAYFEEVTSEFLYIHIFTVCLLDLHVVSPPVLEFSSG